MKQFDYLVLGSGIAGLSFALKVAPRGRVAIVTKKRTAPSPIPITRRAASRRSRARRIRSNARARHAWKAGAGLCKESVVRTIIEEGPARIAGVDRAGHEIFRARAPSERRAGTWTSARRRPFQAPHSARQGRDRTGNRARAARCHFARSRTSRFSRTTSRLI
jgi:aspartate oxidase